jgi:hypothetical protein
MEDVVNYATIVGSIATVIALIIAFLSYRAVQASKKPARRLAVIRQSYTSLVTVDSAIRHDIELRYKGQPIPSIGSMSVKLINEGNKPISFADFRKPLAFSFGEHNTVIEVTQTEASSPGIEAVKTVYQPEAQIEIADTFLLNQKNSVTLNFTILEFEGNARKSFALTGQIIDGSIEETPREKFKFSRGDIFALTRMLAILTAIALFDIVYFRFGVGVFILGALLFTSIVNVLFYFWTEKHLSEEYD